MIVHQCVTNSEHDQTHKVDHESVDVALCYIYIYIYIYALKKECYRTSSNKSLNTKICYRLSITQCLFCIE